MEFHLQTQDLKAIIPELSVGDTVYLSGTVYTSRDAAHKRICAMMQEGQLLPYPLEEAVIYYAGPTPTPPHLAIGSCGPTTSGRMDVYAPAMLDAGLVGMIGKGPRSKAVQEAIVRNQSIYFCAIGGAGALAAKCITSCEVIAFEDLGCESIKRLTFSSFPLTVAIDAKGNSLFK